MFLHRWQLESLIDQLGAYAETFDLDVWLSELNSKQQVIVLPADRWAYVQREFEKEVRRRGLPVAGDRVHWSDRCPHSPRCQNGSLCEILSVVAKARKERGT